MLGYIHPDCVTLSFSFASVECRDVRSHVPLPMFNLDGIICVYSCGCGLKINNPSPRTPDSGFALVMFNLTKHVNISLPLRQQLVVVDDSKCSGNVPINGSL